jgi:surface polysaccharide O-acyltransferase-like enzyme
MNVTTRDDRGPVGGHRAVTRSDGSVTEEPTGWLDLARVLAIVAVVMVHETGAAVGFRGPGVPASPAWWAANVLDAASRWCVPVFLMVSGTLLLDPGRASPPGAFYRRRLNRVGLPLAVWTAVYLLFRHHVLDQPMTGFQAARAVASGAPFLQLYFLYVLAGLYLLTPFLRTALRAMGLREQAWLAAVLLGLGAADQALMTFLDIGEHNAATRFVPYLGYYVAGRVLRQVPRDPRLTRAAVAAVPVSVVVTAALAAVAASGGRGWGPAGEYVYSYMSPWVVALSLATFWLLRVAGTRPGDRWRPGRRTARLSGLAFGIFLVHALFFYPLVRDWQVPTALGPYLVTLTWHVLVTLVASALVTVALRRIPLLRRIV